MVAQIRQALKFWGCCLCQKLLQWMLVWGTNELMRSTVYAQLSQISCGTGDCMIIKKNNVFRQESQELVAGVRIF